MKKDKGFTIFSMLVGGFLVLVVLTLILMVVDVSINESTAVLTFVDRATSEMTATTCITVVPDAPATCSSTTSTSYTLLDEDGRAWSAEWSAYNDVELYKRHHVRIRGDIFPIIVEVLE